MTKKIITGVKPTGSSMHLGNLLGAVLPFKNLAKGNDAAIFIADLHALTSVKDGEKLRAQSLELAIEYLSIFGKDTPITIFRQSDIVDITKLMWVLSNVTPFSLMARAHSYKDFQQKREELLCNISLYDWRIETSNEIKEMMGSIFPNPELQKKIEDELIKLKLINDSETKRLKELTDSYENNLNMWVFNYPILMAADIIGYDVDAVPVGKDQIQHLEMTRDIARAFNKTYGQEVFLEPEAIITREVETLPGIDGRKMSKSYDNFIWVFDDEKTMKKRVMSIVTDSLGVDDVKNPDTCNVFSLIQVFGTPDEIASIREKYVTPNIGFWYGHAKLALLEILQRYLSEYRNTRMELLNDIPFVETKLADGARIMNARLEAKMQVVREVVGIH